MAKRRMFSKEIVRSDAFLDLPVSSRELYFQLGMDTDDRGYIPNAKSVIRLIGANQGDLEPLITKGFLMIRGDTLILQKHFEINNIIRHDRFHETEYIEDLKKLFMKENKAYTEDSSQGKSMISVLGDTNGIPNGNQLPTDTNTILIQNNTIQNNSNSNTDTDSYSDTEEEIEVKSSKVNEKLNPFTKPLVNMLIESRYIVKDSMDEISITNFVIEPLLKSGEDPIKLKEKIKKFINHYELNGMDEEMNKANYLKDYLVDDDDLPF